MCEKCLNPKCKCPCVNFSPVNLSARDPQTYYCTNCDDCSKDSYRGSKKQHFGRVGYWPKKDIYGFKLEPLQMITLHSYNEQKEIKYLKVYYDPSIDAWTIQHSGDLLID